jgi:hypothetical protein
LYLAQCQALQHLFLLCMPSQVLKRHMHVPLNASHVLVTNPQIFCPAPSAEKTSVLLGKAAHYALLLAVPTLLHGLPAAVAGAAGYSVSLSIVLAVVFFVSHNMPENKPNLTGADETKKVRADCTAQQNCTGVSLVGDVLWAADSSGLASSCQRAVCLTPFLTMLGSHYNGRRMKQMGCWGCQSAALGCVWCFKQSRSARQQSCGARRHGWHLHVLSCFTAMRVVCQLLLPAVAVRGPHCALPMVAAMWHQTSTAGLRVAVLSLDGHNDSTDTQSLHR